MRLLILIIFFYCFFSPTLQSQITTNEKINVAEKITNQLTKEGFQDISIRQFDKGYVVAYENRVYRFDALGLKTAIQLTADAAGKEAEEIILLTKRNDIPILSTTFSLNSGLREYAATNTLPSNIAITQDVTSAKLGTSIVENVNSGNYRLELVLRPYFSVELGNRYLEDQFIHLIDIRPKVNIYLWKGAHFTYEFILPISNEFRESAPHWGELRPRMLALSQEVRLPQNIFLNASIGVFSRDRYGASFAMGKYFWDGRLLATGKIGYTGHASYVQYDASFNQLNKGWIYSDMDYVDYKMGLRYWFPKRNIELGIIYGKVLSNRKVVRVEAKQKFKEIELGLFAFKTNEGRNYGVTISIPIFPKKYWNPKRFSVRPSKVFRYEYLGDINLAREYQPQGMYSDFPQDLNPNFMKFQILKGLEELN